MRAAPRCPPRPQAFPLAQLAFVVSLVALASAILGLLGGIFYIVASSLLLAFAIGSAANANRASGPKAIADAEVGALRAHRGRGSRPSSELA